MFEFEDLAHFCRTVLRREGSGVGLRGRPGCVLCGLATPERGHPASHLAGGTPGTHPAIPGSGRAPDAPPAEGRSPHPCPLRPRTSGAAAEAQGRRAFLLFFLFPFYVVCGHIMEGGFWRGLFSCQPELLIQPGVFLSVFLPPCPTPPSSP